MAVRVQKIESNQNSKQARVKLFADAKTDVTDDMEIIGMPADMQIEAGSSVMTAAGEIAYMKSDEEWNWV